MKNLLMMLSVLALLGCKALDSTVSANPEGPVGAEVIPATDTITSKATTRLNNPLAVNDGEVSRRANGNGPLWTIRSEQIAARSQDHSVKTQSRTAKPQGPFTVRYVLESWALDDHRLVVEVRSNQSISDWQVDLPQVVEKQKRPTRLAKPNAAERGAPEARTFGFAVLPETNRLLFTVTAKVSGVTSSKTLSIPLRPSANPLAKACDRTETDCVRLLPAKIIY
jgi:hypothetical protein